MTDQIVDPDALKLFSFQLFTKLEGAVTAGMIHLGDQLGLYTRLKDADTPLTTAELADRAGLAERWVREWAYNQASAKLIVADIDPGKTAKAEALFGATVLPVDQILAAEADVLAPCALGASLCSTSIPTLRAQLVCGAANNQLAQAADGDALAKRGITYLPDYLVNAGGIISVAREYRGEGEEQSVMAEVSRIAERVQELLARVKSSGRTPAAEADAWAQSLIVRA